MIIAATLQWTRGHGSARGAMLTRNGVSPLGRGRRIDAAGSTPY
jgi:hypothetical protein